MTSGLSKCSGGSIVESNLEFWILIGCVLPVFYLNVVSRDPGTVSKSVMFGCPVRMDRFKKCQQTNWGPNHWDVRKLLHVRDVNIWYYLFSVIILILILLMYIYWYAELGVWFQISQTKMHASWHGRLMKDTDQSFNSLVTSFFELWIWIEFISPSGFQIPSSPHCQFGQKQQQWHNVLWWTLVFTFFLGAYNSNIESNELQNIDYVDIEVQTSIESRVIDS